MFFTNKYFIFLIVLIIIILVFSLIIFFFFRKRNNVIISDKNIPKKLESLKLENLKIETLKLEYNILENSEFNFTNFDYTKLNKNSPIQYNTSNYLDKTEIFLKNYKYIFDEKLKTYISIYIKNNKINILNEKKINLKNYLKNTWKLGFFILNSLDTQDSKNLSNYIFFFKQNISNLIEYCKKERKNLLKNYDWFIFASYYPTVILYKLMVDYKLKNLINNEYIEEILYFIPKIDYSLNIKRYDSNMQILSINYLMVIFFKLNNIKKDIDKFLLNLNIENNLHNFLNNYVTSSKDGLYPNGGFITHQGLCSYNYLLASLYPNIFYNLFFDTGNESISRVLKSLFKITNFNIKKCNPSIITRFGNFNELYHNLMVFNNNVVNLKIFKENKEIELLHNYINDLEYQKNSINYIEYFDIITVNYEDWCIQLKNNNNLKYGEVDQKNNNFLKQIYMNKIILFKDIKIDNFLNHSKYPGVLFYKNFKDFSEVIKPIKYNTESFNFEKVFFSNGLIFENLYFIFNKVINKQLKIEYSELVLFFPEGIVVGYFDVKTHLNQDLYLCLNNNLIYQNKIFYGVLYDNIINNKIINENNKYHYIKVNNDIIYYNFYIDKLFKLNFYNKKNNINIVFIYKRKNININIKKNNKIYIEIF